MHKSWAREEKNGNSLFRIVFCQLVHTDCFNNSHGNLYSLTSYDMCLFHKPCLPYSSLPTLPPLNSSPHLPLKHLIIPNFHFVFFFFPQNAYTATAINSTNFCTSAKDAFVILVENALRVAAINTVGDFMLFLGKVRMLYTVVAFHGSKLPLATTCTPRYKMPLNSCFWAWLYHI